MVMAKKAHGYLPLVRDKDPLAGILVARKDSGLHSVRDLQRKEIVFPSPNAFAAALYMRALLAEREQVRFTPRYVKTHSNVYRTVLLGKAVAGGGVNKTFQLEPQELRDQLVIIYETPGAAPHPIAAHPRVPEKARAAVAKAILEMGRNQAEKQLLAVIQMPDPRATDYEKDYRPLENLGLEQYVVEDME
jgi:phosphonate transport system substrate-binding protein